MKRTAIRCVGAIAWSILLNAATATAAPCLTATAACVEYFAVRNGPARMLIYRSHSLATPAPEITHAIVVVHGAERDAATSFRITAAAAVLSGRPESTLVVAPRFAARTGSACADNLAADELGWQCDVQLKDWRMGGAALSDDTLASFDVVDALLMAIEDGRQFPNLRSIVVLGHSAGGQFVTNYQMTNRYHEGLRVPPTYVAANASAYAYPDPARPTLSDSTTCPTYADWPFGTSARVGYVSRPTTEQIQGVTRLGAPLLSWSASWTLRRQAEASLVRAPPLPRRDEARTRRGVWQAHECSVQRQPSDRRRARMWAQRKLYVLVESWYDGALSSSKMSR